MEVRATHKKTWAYVCVCNICSIKISFLIDYTKHNFPIWQRHVPTYADESSLWIVIYMNKHLPARSLSSHRHICAMVGNVNCESAQFLRAFCGQTNNCEKNFFSQTIRSDQFRVDEKFQLCVLIWSDCQKVIIAIEFTGEIKLFAVVCSVSRFTFRSR